MNQLDAQNFMDHSRYFKKIGNIEPEQLPKRNKVSMQQVLQKHLLPDPLLDKLTQNPQAD